MGFNFILKKNIYNYVYENTKSKRNLDRNISEYAPARF